MENKLRYKGGWFLCYNYIGDKHQDKNDRIELTWLVKEIEAKLCDAKRIVWSK